MSDNQRQVDRRELLKATGTVAAAGPVVSSGQRTGATGTSQTPKLRPPLTINPDKLSQELLNAIRITPRVNHDPFPAYAGSYLPFAMAQSNEVTRSGRVWTAWIGGKGRTDRLPAGFLQ
ncbi:MAG: hypothetical protein CM1200mP2_35400 [Planctomycetaceae bacterium]|nr:MAG: hypothetical protein CM1200mP2_35400 [Planctomycetaceae bacterium]